MSKVYLKKFSRLKVGLGVLVLLPFLSFTASAENKQKIKMPKIREKAVLTFAPNVPPPIQRKGPAVVEVYLDSSVKKTEIKPGVTYQYWTFNDDVPGPFIRVRVGDVLEAHHTN